MGKKKSPNDRKNLINQTVYFLKENFTVLVTLTFSMPSQPLLHQNYKWKNYWCFQTVCSFPGNFCLLVNVNMALEHSILELVAHDIRHSPKAIKSVTDISQHTLLAMPCKISLAFEIHHFLSNLIKMVSSEMPAATRAVHKPVLPHVTSQCCY